MTILDLLNGKTVNYIQVNVLKQINPDQYIVGDRTGLAILNLDSDKRQNIEVGKGLKMVKPSIAEKVITCHPKFSPMKTKALLMDLDSEKMDELELIGKSKKTCTKGTNFQQIEDNYGSTAVIDRVLVYVTTKSRNIDGKYGAYQICNLKDFDGNSASINLYRQHLNKLEVNKVYTLEKIKKTEINTDSGIRMATTNFTKIKVATQAQIEIFAEVDIADHKITGTCVMFNDLSYYKSCNKHLSRLSDDGCCSDCGHIGKDDGKVDFRCSLIIEDCDDDTMVAVVIFKRHLELNLCYDDDEDKLI